jgi:hypothetical protein
MFTKSSLAELSGLDPRSVTFLIDKGVIRPDSGGGRRGANFSFSWNGALDACVAAELFRFGITYKVINAFLKDFRKSYDYGSRMIKSEAGTKGGKWLILRPEGKNFRAIIVHAERPKVEERKITACIVIDMALIEDRVEAANRE